jgi:hypothetical protein
MTLKQDLYDQYAALAVARKKLETEMETLLEAIVADMNENGLVTLQHEAGTFSMMTRKNYEYPHEVTILEERIKAEKASAIENGRAIETTTSFLRFQAKKN